MPRWYHPSRCDHWVRIAWQTCFWVDAPGYKHCTNLSAEAETMAHRKKGERSGKKGGSVTDQVLDAPAKKGKPKKQKKQSKGKHKK